MKPNTLLIGYHGLNKVHLNSIRVTQKLFLHIIRCISPLVYNDQIVASYSKTMHTKSQKKIERHLGKLFNITKYAYSFTSYRALWRRKSNNKI